MSIETIAFSFIAGACGALGIGGGSFLLLYLTLFAGVEQLKSQGINLIFFLPCSAVALFFHFKNNLIDKKAALTAIIWGVLGVALGSLSASWLGGETLRKIFAALLIIMGIRELLPDKSKKN